MKNYYSEQQMIAGVDREGNILGKIEKWKAHRLGILHRGFTVIVLFEDFLILQHRKHPAFDGTFDMAISSHQVFLNGKLQDITDAVYIALKRELNIEKSDLVSKAKNLGSIYYKAKDPKSEFTEHEIDDVLVVEVKKIPTPNLDFSHGLSLVKKEEISDKKSRIYNSLVPWAKVMIEKNMF